MITRVSSLSYSSHFENSVPVPDPIWKSHREDSGTGAGTGTIKNKDEIKQSLIHVNGVDFYSGLYSRFIRSRVPG